jgi:hypothetical protein
MFLSIKKIAISEKLAPYSHLPGTRCVVPCSDWVVEIFPALLRIVDKTDFAIEIAGPIEQFFVQLDLEKDCVWISGKGAQGCYRLQLTAAEEGLFVAVQRAPKQGIAIGEHHLAPKEKLLLAKGGKVSPRLVCERLSLGNWKAQDVDLVRRRGDVREIVPTLFLLGQKIPAVAAVEGAIPKMDLFFRSSFSGLFVPHLQDPLHQGISREGDAGDPMAILGLAYRTIRGHLIEEGEGDVRILPGIKEYPVGRASLRTSFGWVHLEWTQGIMRRCIVEPKENCQHKFVFPKEVASFRCCGQKVLNGDVVSLEADRPVLFDRFFKA